MPQRTDHRATGHSFGLRPRFSTFNGYDIAALVLFAAALVIAIATFRDYAVSNDEPVQHRYGELILSYYASGFTDRSLFSFDNLYLYGGLFDIAAVSLSRLIPFDPYDVRHLLCVLIGLAGIGAAWATARLIAGSRAALIAAATLLVCGSWYGAMFNHTKDIPLAAAMTGGLYFLILVARGLPYPKLRHVVGFGLLTGAALGMKVLGLLLLVYAGIAILLSLPAADLSDVRKASRFVALSTAAFIPAVLLAYLIMIAAWPWSALDPANPIRALFSFAKFHYQIPTILAGERYEMATSPPSYVPIYIAIKVPLVIFCGAVIALLLTMSSRLRRTSAPHAPRNEILLIAIAAAFPVACQYLGRGPAFTGMRHFLFVVPPLCVLAGIGLDTALAVLARWQRRIAIAAAASLAALVSWNAVELVRLHPYEYMAYNSLVGGLPGAQRRYVMDYWVNIMPEAVRQIDRTLAGVGGARSAEPSHVFRVAVCGERLSFEREIGTRRDLKWTSYWPESDFFIAPTHGDCDRALDGRTVATIERLGVPIGVVKDRRMLPRPKWEPAGEGTPVARSPATGPVPSQAKPDKNQRNL